MKVFGSDPNSNRVTNKGSGIGKAVKNSGAESRDGNKVLSEAASRSTSEKVVLTAPKEMAEAKAVIARTPDVRTKKVEELKERIDKGEYHVPGKEIAGKMLIEMLGS